MRAGRNRRDVPQFPIAPILEALGFENVPHVTGGHAKVRCAFHGDRTPSASVSRLGFTCFVCDRSGDAIKLIREEESLGFEDAVKRCAELTGVQDREVPQQRSWGDELSVG